MEFQIMCLLGPTGSGKTSIVTEIADQFGLEIVSLDSAMVYKELTIGVNKPTAQELIQCPHHVINCTSVQNLFHVGQFIHLANQAVDDILSRGKIPVIVGGSMMYAYQMKFGLLPAAQLPPEQKREFRVYWQSRELKDALSLLDQIAPNRVRCHDNDRQRVLRQLEIELALQQGLQDTAAVCFKYPIQWYGLEFSNNEQHRNLLTQRFYKMIKDGFEEEVAALMRDYPDEYLPFWKFVGYRQLRMLLEGKMSTKEAHERACFANFHLAKHQRTWMRKMKPVFLHVEYDHYYQCHQLRKQIEQYVAQF